MAASPRGGSRPRRPPLLRRFVALSVALGFVAAGIALPVVGTAAIAARNAVQDFEQLPSILDAPPSAARSVILAADGSVLGEIASENRIQVPLNRISNDMRAAVIAIEDARFYEHGGVDLRGSLRALATNSSAGTVQQGGSTLTQQYVKNVLIEDAATPEERDEASERTLARKLREARYALALEARLSKDEILERYLNIAYFGDGAYGVEAAANHYFGVTAAELDLPMAATLAGIVQSPVSYDPTLDPELSQKRRDVVLDRMLAEGLATASDVADAQALPLEDYLDITDVPTGCVRSFAPYFCDYVLSIIRGDEAFGATRADRQALLNRGGLTIRTTLDADVQRKAQAVVDRTIPRDDPSRKATAAVSVTPGTGAIVSMAQNTTYGTKGRQTTVNYAVGSDANGWRDGVQAGSTFKTFTLAAALEKGIPLTTSLSTRGVQTFSGFRDCEGDRFAPYTVRSGSAGTNSMTRATAFSVNGYFVALEERAGLCETARMVDRLGIRTATGDRVPQVPSLTLGSASTTPLDVAAAYAAFAADGTYCEPVAITEIVDRDGRDLALPASECQAVMKPAVARSVTKILTNVIDGPIRGRTGAAMTLGRPAAGKTGTTENNAAVWFAGYTPQLATAVWVGDPRGGARYPMKNVTVNGRFYSQAFGGTLAGPIWREVMLAALEGEPKRRFAPADPAGGVVGVPTTVPDVVALGTSDAQQRLEEAGLVGTVSSPAVASALPAGTVLRTSPAAGARSRSGERVALVVSSGVPPQTATPTPAPTTTASATPTPSPAPPAPRTDPVITDPRTRGRP